jgi:RimJ/RimL family protein N-acetyltransferase
MQDHDMDADLGTPRVRISEAGVLLRPFRPDDEDEVFRACQDPQIQRWTSIPRPYLREHAHQYVAEFTPRAWAAGTAAPMGAFDERTGQLLGAIGLITQERGGEAEVGYWVAPWGRRRGVATAGTRALARWAFATLDLRRLRWRAEVGNHASRLVAETLGFQVEGVQRNGVIRPDGRVADCWFGALLPGELREAGTAAHPVTRLRAMTFSAAQPRLVGTTADGEPVSLRAPDRADADAMVAACSDPASQEWTTVPRPYDAADAEAFIHDAAPRRWAYGDGAIFAVTDANDAFIGSMALRLGPRPDTADVGYLIAPWVRGRGYAPAALRLLATWGVSALGLNRIEWRAYIGNEASRRVAEKAGFTVEGAQRDGCVHLGEYRDAWSGAILASDLATAEVLVPLEVPGEVPLESPGEIPAEAPVEIPVEAAT